MKQDVLAPMECQECGECTRTAITTKECGCTSLTTTLCPTWFCNKKSNADTTKGTWHCKSSRVGSSATPYGDSGGNQECKLCRCRKRTSFSYSAIATGTPKECGCRKGISFLHSAIAEKTTTKEFLLHSGCCKRMTFLWSAVTTPPGQEFCWLGECCM